MLATYFPLITLTLLGDAPVEAALPAQATFDLLAMIPPEARGYLIAAAVSALAAAANQALRRQKAKGKKSGPVVMFFLSFLNLFAGNLDQTARQVKAAKAKEPQS